MIKKKWGIFLLLSIIFLGTISAQKVKKHSFPIYKCGDDFQVSDTLKIITVEELKKCINTTNKGEVIIVRFYLPGCGVNSYFKEFVQLSHENDSITFYNIALDHRYMNFVKNKARYSNHEIFLIDLIDEKYMNSATKNGDAFVLKLFDKKLPNKNEIGNFTINEKPIKKPEKFADFVVKNGEIKRLGYFNSLNGTWEKYKSEILKVLREQ